MLIFILNVLDTESDRERFIKIYEKYKKLMHLVAVRILNDNFLAEDAVHEAFINAAKTERVYKQIPKFPGISRDIAVVVDKEVAVGDILKTCKSAGGKLLKEVEFFDVYEDSKLGDNKKSVAVSLIFRDDSKTLADADIKAPYDSIIAKLEKVYDAHLR